MIPRPVMMRLDMDNLSEEQQELVDDLPVEDFPIELIDSFTPSLRENLKKLAMTRFTNSCWLSEEELTGVKGIGKQTAVKIKEMIDFLVQHYEDEYEEDEERVRPVFAREIIYKRLLKCYLSKNLQ